ncbi:hypothetical protein [Bradyrhizobium japonicum]|uniref:hypothetical protein n=1 Tax=Bradyrhizobium japonicum TaxID=375 RepID=UPI0004AE3846|nr:hypothetical protein [Bradyrhizobium japonicum]
METREDYLLRLASGLEGLATDERLIVRDPYIERAFGGTRALAIAEAGVFAGAHGCTFRYDRMGVNWLVESARYCRS